MPDLSPSERELTDLYLTTLRRADTAEARVKELEDALQVEWERCHFHECLCGDGLHPDCAHPRPPVLVVVEGEQP